jgi:hypothetical protein
VGDLTRALRGADWDPETGKVTPPEPDPEPGETRRRSGLYVIRDGIEVPVLVDEKDAIAALPTAGPEGGGK